MKPFRQSVGTMIFAVNRAREVSTREYLLAMGANPGSFAPKFLAKKAPVGAFFAGKYSIQRVFGPIWVFYVPPANRPRKEIPR
jgi:hypothetical protein